MSLDALLGEWAGLEPERCISPQRSKPEIQRTGEYHVKFNGGFYGVFNSLVQEHYPESPECAMYVQVAVQEAIEARGWEWTLQSYDSERYQARRCLAWLGVTPEEQEKSAPTAAEALLTVYLQVLRAAKETR